jgi:hypothetical protein
MIIFIVSVVFVGFPECLSAWWNFFHSEPLVPWLIKNGVTLPNIPVVFFHRACWDFSFGSYLD